MCTIRTKLNKQFEQWAWRTVQCKWRIHIHNESKREWKKINTHTHAHRNQATTMSANEMKIIDIEFAYGIFICFINGALASHSGSLVIKSSWIRPVRTHVTNGPHAFPLNPIAEFGKFKIRLLHIEWFYTSTPVTVSACANQANTHTRLKNEGVF